MNSSERLPRVLQKERIYLYDNVKFLAIVLVVIGHAIDKLAQIEGNHFEASLYSAIYSVHMPLFIFISGLFLKPMDKQSKFPAQKVLSFFFIGIILRIINSVVRLMLGMKPDYSILIMTDNYTWFMSATAAFIALTWLLRRLNAKVVLFVAFVIGCMAGYDNNLGDKFALMRITVFFPIFLLGYYLTPDMISKLASKRWIKVLSAVVVVGFLALWFFKWNIAMFFRPLFTGRNRFSVLGEYSGFGALFRIACYLISICLGFSVICLIPNRNFGYLTKMGTKTLQIYFWHRMILLVLERFSLYQRLENHLGGTVATGIYILIAVGIAFLCSIKIFSFPTKQILSFANKYKSNN